MKKSILPIFAVMALFVACGPSKEELEKRQTEIKDSIQAVNDQIKADLDAKMQAMQDSIAEAAKLATENMQSQVDEVKAELEKKSEQAASNANATKKELEKMKQDEKAKAEEAKKKEAATVKPGQGRG